VITNLVESYALFIYECNSIEWSGRFTFATIGFNSPSDVTFTNHPLTGLSNANEVSCRDRNLLYQISASQGRIEELRQMCMEWYISDMQLFNESSISLLNVSTTSCPCSLFQAVRDFRFRLFSIGNNIRCYTLRFPGDADRECCYSVESFTFGSLIIGTADEGSLLLFTEPTLESYQENNFRPKSYCCSDGVGLCSFYFARRPTNRCERYIPPRISE